jgi:hypothetical protein
MAFEKCIGEFAAPVGKEFHTNAPEGVKNVVRGFEGSSILRAR